MQKYIISQQIVLMAKIDLYRDLALAREVINDYENALFDLFLLDPEYLVSVKPLCHFIKIMSDHNEILRIIFCGKNIYLPFIRFCTENPYPSDILFANRFWLHILLVSRKYFIKQL